MNTTEFFAVTAEITYRPFRVPLRCRKPRQVEETFVHKIAIPSVTSTEAPVAAIIPNDRGHLGAPGRADAELRFYDDKLWTVETETRDCTSPAVLAGSDHFPSSVTTSYWIESQRDAVEQFESAYRSYLIVDGSVWRQTEEPVYAVQSLGMGHNHGGTYLDIEVLPAGKHEDRMFTLTDHEAAVAGALAIAKRYGDDQSYERIRNTPKATILDPAAFRVPANDQRIAAAEDEVRAIAKKARALLVQEVSHDSLKEVKKLVEQAESVLWKHGLEAVPVPPR